MKDWGDKLDLLEAVTRARIEARDNVPRSGGNDAIEAGMFIAMLHAVDQWSQAEPDAPPQGGEPAGPEPSASPPAEPLAGAPPEPAKPELPENSYVQ